VDIVFIRELKVDTVVGIYDWEKRMRQHVVLDIEMGADIARAAKTDAIGDTLDYKAVAKRVHQFIQEGQFGLVETLAEKVAGIIMQEFQVPWVKITLNKTGAVSGSRSVGVVIERGKRG
jgi:dihydroneopterin aldolase